MNTKAASSNNKSTPAIPANNVLAALKALTIKYAHSLIQAMAKHAENGMFSSSDESRHSKDPSAYFESLRIIAANKDKIEINYCQQVEKQFSKYLSTSTQPHKNNTTSDKLLFTQLSLMEDVDLQESLAIGTIIEKIRHNYSQDIRAIEKRIAHIYPDIQTDPDTSPFDPKALCDAYQDAIRDFDFNIKAKIVIYKIFDKQLSTTIKDFYTEINNSLIEAGVLPEIKPELPKATGSRYPHRQKTGDTNASEATTQGNSNSSSSGNESVTPITSPEVLVSLQKMLAQIHPGGEHEQINRTNFASAAETSEQIITALHQIHNELQTQAYTPSPDGTTDGSLVTSLADPREISQQFKTMLLSQALQENGANVSINQIDNGIIDIVSILFEYILDDENLPAVAKAQIARLQIPLLKIAILNKEFFNTQGHPARQLLNALAKAGLGIDDSEDTKNNPVLNKIKYVVHEIIHNFKNDIQLFTDLLNEFNSFIEEEKARQLESESTIIQQQEQKEDHALAKQWVKNTLSDFLAGKKLPEQIEKIIKGPWAKVMLHTYIEQGSDSSLWKNQLRFIDVLAWSLDATQMSVDHKKLCNIIAHLIKTMREGLKEIDYPKEKTEKLFRALESYHLASIRKIKPIEKPVSGISSAGIHKPDSFFLFSATSPAKDNCQDDSSSDSVKLNPVEQTIENLEAHVASMSELEAMLEEVMDDPQDAMHNIEDIVLTGHDSHEKPEGHLDDEFLEQARNLKPGVWLEFIAEYGKKQRAKLVWKSELLGEYTFLNWKFDVVADMSLFVLAADLRTNRARIIDDVPLLDRALTAILSGFRRKPAEH
ncbi:MAG: DUF1631 domain-containing protein [Gammaproteobacteria bacterium]|nr:DUF1631 domain-containing protein [Gammaproteobacteria bacterium]